MDNTNLIKSVQMSIMGDSGTPTGSGCRVSLFAGGLMLSQGPYNTKAHGHGNFTPTPILKLLWMYFLRSNTQSLAEQ